MRGCRYPVRIFVNILIKLIYMIGILTCLYLIYHFSGNKRNEEAKHSVFNEKTIYRNATSGYEDNSHLTEVKSLERKTNPKMVLLIAYQRTGSTLTGQLLHQNPNAFYMFEPGDAIYQAMYGTQPGYNVPTDIFFFPNASKRTLPEIEKLFVGDSLNSLMRCDFANTPIEILTHTYLNNDHFYFGPSVTHISPYIDCLKTKCDCYSKQCSDIARQACPKKFSPLDKTQSACFKFLQLENRKSANKDVLFDYKYCLKKLKQNVLERCMNIIQKICDGTSIRAVKTVRVTMDVVQYMQTKFGNMKIVHLIRDPRAVALSRKLEPVSMYGKASGSNITMEAYLYCKQVMHDINVRNRLESHFPGISMEIVYEDLTQDVKKYATDIYSFLNEAMSEEVIKWIDNKKDTFNESAHRNHRWKYELAYGIQEEIKKLCSDFYSTVKHNWM